MVILFSVLYLFFGSISCNKKDAFVVDPGKKTEQIGEKGESGEDKRGEDKDFNYDEFKVHNGFHVPFPLGETPSPYGYYMYFPESYKQQENRYPVLIFLHGSGERGDSKRNKLELDKAVKHGPGKLINNGTWSPKEEMLVVSAQTAVNRWDTDKIRKLIDYLLETYRIDESRVYLTGLSLGGSGTYNYIARYGRASKVAAAVPICGRNNSDDADYVKKLAEVPLWIFHGQADPQVDVSYALKITRALNAVHPKEAPKLTLYPNVGHDSWTRTYDGSGQGQENPEYDAFDQDIYSWMLQHRLP